MTVLSTEDCPCGTGEPYGRCCLLLHAGERQAETAEQLMRARYSAYAVGDLDYVWSSWHPRTRPERTPSDSGLVWIGLDIVDTAAGLPGDDYGEVEFRAHYLEDDHGERQRSGTLHERSRFAVRARRWFYLDGDDR